MNPNNRDRLLQATLDSNNITMDKDLAFALAGTFGSVDAFNGYCNRNAVLDVKMETAFFDDKTCAAIYSKFHDPILTFVRHHAKKQGLSSGADWIFAAMELVRLRDKDAIIKAMFEDTSKTDQPTDYFYALSRIVVHLTAQKLATKHQKVLLTNNTSKEVEEFKEFSNGLNGVGIYLKTVNSLIKALGGENGFRDTCLKMEGSSSCEGISGFLFADERVEFFIENRDELLAFIQIEAKSKDFKTKTDYILSVLNKQSLAGRNIYNADDVGFALYGDHSFVVSEEAADVDILDYSVKIEVSSMIVFSFIDTVATLFREQLMVSQP